ncbi:hypothetical protein AWB79_05536 [Caballeronia hypogeia]|uniref:Peptidase metallopeptidase domain-containing protein n=1 Tax=Caballeronia hypogeia TaxID=1777140 RepID=A0A158CLT5_9BURK|nr:ATPase [Caballeronia hypogeia]SAK82826.1 hypothetical protein AWB79_05536 [Caballeronia hypogeia]
MKRLRGLVLVLLSGLLISGCGGGDSGGGAPSSTVKSAVEESSAMDKTTIKGYALSTVIWKQVPIGVCWDMSNTDFALYSNERNWSRQAVQDSWEENSGVEFTGWQQCTNDPNYYGIRITVEDVVGSGPHTMGLGTMLNNKVGGMALNFTFKNWSPDCQRNKEYCIRNVAAHEFGHALGFAHEQNRVDTPSSCKEPAQGTSGDTMIGAWDLASIMNYCNPEWNGNGKLSATDTAMAQKFYGLRKVNGTVYALSSGVAPIKVTAYDIATRAAKASMDLKPLFSTERVEHLFASVDGRRVHVDVSEKAGPHHVLTIDTATNSVLSTTDLMRATTYPYSVQPALDGRLIYQTASNTIGIFDTDSGQMTKKIVLPAKYDLIKLATTKGDSGGVYVLTNTGYAATDNQEIIRVDPATGAITRTYTLGLRPNSRIAQLAVTSDAKRAYFFNFTSTTAGNMSELDLTTGNIRALTDLSEQKPTFLAAVTDQQILYADDNYTSANPIILYDAVGRKKTIPLATAILLEQVQYEPKTGSIFHARGTSDSVKQLQPQTDGTYKNIDLDMRTSGTQGGVAPFVFVPR